MEDSPSASSSSRGWDAFMGECSPAFDACALPTTIGASASSLGWLLPRVPHPKLSYSAESSLNERVSDRVDSLSSWLDENTDKPAEPFNTWAADEVVDVAPIHRPNSDEDISGDRGNDN